MPVTRDDPSGLELLENLARWIWKGAGLVAPCNQLDQTVSQGSASSQARLLRVEVPVDPVSERRCPLGLGSYVLGLQEI